MVTITIDPGEHIGVITTYDTEANSTAKIGNTFTGEDRNRKLWSHLCWWKPQVIVYEEFALRQNMAQKLTGNKFITCEVIGVIKLYCQVNKHVKLIPLQPVNKEYCGFSSNPKEPRYKEIVFNCNESITEHVRDAYRLYNYAKLFKGI